MTVSSKLSPYLDFFGETLRRTSGEPRWLRERRELAMERFLALGLPTRRHEEYKYTNLKPLSDPELLVRPAGNHVPAARAPNAGDRGVSLVFTGATAGISAHGQLPAGVRVGRISEALREDPERLKDSLAAIGSFSEHALCAINTAFFEDGAVIEVAPGVVVEEPVQVAFGPGPAGLYPRVLIIAHPNSSLSVVETYYGSGTYWRNAVCEIRCAPNARVNHYRAQVESPQAYHTGVLQGLQERDSYVGTFSLSFGGALTRNDIGTRLNGVGCECSLDGLYAVRARQFVDHHTAIDHAMPHCKSHQLYKGVLDGRAKGVFNGKIFVRADAQKTDAVQSNKNLLLSDHAEVNTKPQLEIDANDVRCTHGATVGQLDAMAAFYLRSRGIGASDARNILTYAFAADALKRVRIAPLREHFEKLLLARVAPEVQ